jgi:cytoplasmic tRNA 2-thiolation protein 2
LHIVHSYVDGILSRGRRSPFDLDAICIDTDISDRPNTLLQETVETYRQCYPRLNLEIIPLTAVLGIPSIDWSALPTLNHNATPAEQLQDLFSRLPSTTSRADILRLFVRHLLIHTGLARGCQAVLFGHSTTTLGALTLAETAKGRGFSLPWQINDGVLPVEDFSTPSRDHLATPKRSIRVHYPLRELYRKELDTYATLTKPPLTDIIPAEEVVDRAGSVVSHRDLSIDEVMVRYFADVEENYPSIVANVVRTTAKLSRLDAEGRCGICGMTLDEMGDERWKGEIGDQGREGETGQSRLCYGCERSVHG